MGYCFNEIMISASTREVWDVISDFYNFDWAPQTIKSVRVGEENNEIGPSRILNDVFYETLISIDHDLMQLSYKIDDGPYPVSREAVRNYVGLIRLSPVGDSTLVTWRSSYESAEDEAVREFCNPIYSSLLKELKAFVLNKKKLNAL